MEPLTSYLVRMYSIMLPSLKIRVSFNRPNEFRPVSPAPARVAIVSKGKLAHKSSANLPPLM